MEPISLALGSRQDISIRELLKLAKEADDLGYTGCFVGESWGMDAFTTLSLSQVALRAFVSELV